MQLALDTKEIKGFLKKGTVFLSTENNQGKLTVADESWVYQRVFPIKKMEKQGETILPLKAVDFLGAFNGEIEIIADDREVQLNGDDFNIKMPLSSTAKETVIMSGPQCDQAYEIKMNKGMLSVISGEKDVRLPQAGIIETGGKESRLVCLDGYRIAITNMDTDFPMNDKVVVPKDALEIAMSRELNKCYFDEKTVMFTNNDNENIISRVLDKDSVPDSYREILDENKNEILNVTVVETKLLKDALSRIKLISDWVGIKFEQNKMTLSASSENNEIIKQVVVTKNFSGEPLRAYYNVNYLLDLFKISKQKDIQLELAKEPRKNILIAKDKEEGIKYLLLPCK